MQPDDEAPSAVTHFSAPLAIDPLATTIRETQRATGYSRSEVYRRLASGDLRAVKSGTKTMVLVASIREHIASLPAATFRPAT